MRTPLLICLTLVALNLAVFLQVRDFDFVNYDDGIHVYDNPAVKLGLSSEGITQVFTSTLYGNYIPITMLTYLLNFELGSFNPGGYHLTNLLFHIANSLLLFIVLWRLSSALWPSAFAAALFAIHPLHVESVAWISARKDLVSTFFMLLVMLAYTSYARKPRPLAYLAALVLFALGLLGKSMLVTLPCLLLLLDYWPLNRFSNSVTKTAPKRLNLILEKVPFFLLTLVISVVTFTSQRAVEAVQSTDNLSLGPRVTNAIVAYAAYIGKTLWPANLIPYYAHRGATLSGLSIVVALALLIVISALCIRLRRTRPYLIVGWLWFLGALVPVIGLVQVGGQAMADRYTYMPLIGLFIMAAWAAKDCTLFRPALGRPFAVAGLVIVLALSIVSWRQTQHWKNSFALFEHTLRISPKNEVALANLGEAHLSEGRADKAIPLIEAVLADKPNDAGNLRNLASAYRAQGRIEEAQAQLSLALKQDRESPKTFNLLGLMLLEQGDNFAARRRFKRALEFDPEFVPARINLGNALLEKDFHQKAIEQYRFVLERHPNHADALTNMGATMLELGKYEEALPYLERALAILPNDAVTLLNLAVAQFELGRIDDARLYATRALESDPEFSKAEEFLQLIQGQ